MIKFNRHFLYIFSFILSIYSPLVFGHGGVSMDQDVCIMKVGDLRAHFTGYQPEYRATQEFCEDIPVVGPSIFVVDFINDDLRSLEVDFRIIEDVNQIGNNAVLEDLGGPEAIENATIFYEPRNLYPRGTMSAEFNFVSEGRYIGIVTAKYPETGTILTSVFPFQVGLTDYWKFIWPIILIIVFSTAGFGLFVGNVRAKEKQSSQ